MPSVSLYTIVLHVASGTKINYPASHRTLSESTDSQLPAQTGISRLANRPRHTRRKYISGEIGARQQRLGI